MNKIYKKFIFYILLINCSLNCMDEIQPSSSNNMVIEMKEVNNPNLPTEILSMIMDNLDACTREFNLLALYIKPSRASLEKVVIILNDKLLKRLNSMFYVIYKEHRKILYVCSNYLHTTKYQKDDNDFLNLLYLLHKSYENLDAEQAEIIINKIKANFDDTPYKSLTSLFFNLSKEVLRFNLECIDIPSYKRIWCKSEPAGLMYIMLFVGTGFSTPGLILCSLADNFGDSEVGLGLLSIGAGAIGFAKIIIIGLLGWTIKSKYKINKAQKTKKIIKLLPANSLEQV